MMLLHYRIFFIIIMTLLSVRAYAQHGEQYAWTVQHWSGNDRPYYAVEKAIDNQLGSDKNKADIIIQHYKDKAQANPLDQLAVYRWAYSFLSSSSPTTQTTQYYKRQSEVYDAMLQVHPPYTHRYMRMLYLLASSNMHYRWFGEKLIKADFNDRRVLYKQIYVLINILEYRLDIEAKNGAIRYAKQLLKIEPNHANNWAALGEIYYICMYYRNSSNTNDAKQAVAAYNEYLRLVDVKDPYKHVFEKDYKRILNWQKTGVW